MQNLDLNVLTLILGLSVYVSSIRFVVLSRLLSESSPAKKDMYKTFLRWLIPADAALLIAGLLLFLVLFWKNLFGGVAPECFTNIITNIIVWSFFFGVIWLAGHHIVSYVKTLRA